MATETKIWKTGDEKLHKLVDGWCKTPENRPREIKAINHELDKQGGYNRPYVNTPKGTKVILDGDSIVVQGKKIIEVIEKQKK